MGFTIPVHLGDLELGSPTGYTVDRSVAAAGIPTGLAAQRGALEALESRIEDGDSFADVFDEFYVLVRDTHQLEDAVAARLVDVLAKGLCHAKLHESLRAGATAAPAELKVGRESYVMACYLCHAAICHAEATLKAEKAAAPGKPKAGAAKKNDKGSSWDKQRAGALTQFAAGLEGVDVKWLWSLGVVDDAFLLMWLKVGANILAESTVPKAPAAVRDAALGVVAAPYRAAPPDFGASAAAAVVEDLVLASEQGAAAAADLCRVVAEAGDARLAGDVLRELARVAETETANESVRAKCVAKFIETLGEKAPALAIAHVSTLKSYLDAGSHALRSAVVSMLAKALEVDAEKHRALAERQGDEDEEDRLATMSDATRAALFDLVFERIRDVSNFTRAATLKALCSLVETDSIPVSRFVDVSALACERLRDKSVLPRKHALVLLAKCLAHNPYGPTLHPRRFIKAVEQHEAELLELDVEEQVEEAETPEELEEDAASADKKADKRARLLRLLDYNSNAALLIKHVEHAAPDVTRLLRSTSAMDAVEAARFFAVARQFELPCAVAGMRAVLPLACSETEAVKAEAARVVAQALSIEDDDAKTDAQTAAARFAELVSECGPAEVSCLQELAAAAEAVSAKLPRLASPKVVRALWALATGRDSSKRVAAISALGVACAARGSAAVDAAALMEMARFIEQDEADCELGAALASLVCDVFGANAARGGAASKRATVLAPEVAAACKHLLAKLRRQLTSNAATSKKESGAWYTAADKTLEATFGLDSQPEALAAEVVGRLAKKCAFGVNFTEATDPSDAAKLFHVVGHVALQLVASAEELGAALKRATAKYASAAAAATVSSADDEDLDKELGAGAEQSDADHDMRIQRLVECDVVSEKGVIGTYGAIVAKVVSDALPRRENDTTLHVPRELHCAAVLCLAKLACVSRKFCDEHLALLVTTLARAELPEARVNVAVAIGDLAARQPNSVEPWTEHIYQALRDSASSVRKSILATLAHLALNDMIKAKGGGVAEVALRIVDEDPVIQRRARHFFDELSKKQTASHSPVYNLLPDVISRLSVARKPSQDEALTTEDFQKIMAFLLKFVDKDKHVESLAEKLCHRIAGTRADDDGVVANAKGGGADDGQARANRDFAFCLSKLALGDKGARKLAELLPLYKDALLDADVFAVFSTIALKAQKAPKEGDASNAFANEWLNKLQAHHEGRAADDDAAPADAAPQTAKKATKRIPRKKAAARRKNVSDDDDDDDENVPVKSSRKPSRARAAA
ncbi:non-SMC mitotic condensation complex subunit 1-domain-containing protein [Pelagophyceae sp. CCMP2097]|nr:non-SMC mitotic condensation complex subunit 1-domain-containing protein [Pelagophyceae sp. CCMP2097]|mmetsp:Transcript_11226/g.38973  ORF Transcript_11226/g.38973 Transcript_11226/m.38973 type:complete len:1277 (+) Transcript_11226:57-3887(+)